MISAPNATQFERLSYIGLFYDAEQNIFVNEDGFIVWSIFDVITPNDLYLFHQSREYTLVPHRSIPKLMVEIYYPEDD